MSDETLWPGKSKKLIEEHRNNFIACDSDVVEAKTNLANFKALSKEMEQALRRHLDLEEVRSKWVMSKLEKIIKDKEQTAREKWEAQQKEIQRTARRK